MVKKLTLTQHQEIQVAALEVIDAVNRMRDQMREGSWFGPFQKIVIISGRIASIQWPALERAVQHLQRTIDGIPGNGQETK